MILQTVRFEVSQVRRAISAAGLSLLAGLYQAVVSVGLIATGLMLTGCYTSAAATVQSVQPSALVTAQISDVGRVALSEQAGPEVARMDGKVASRSDSSVVLMVSNVSYLNGLSNAWQGQQMTLRPQDVKSVTVRTFSRSRTALTIGLMAGALAIIIAKTGFLGLLSGDSSRDKPVEPPPSS